MIQLRFVYVLVFICIKFTFGDQRYEHISSYEYHGGDSLEFTCNLNIAEQDIFNGNSYLNLHGYAYFSKSNFEKIYFRNCRFREIEIDFFEEFSDLREFNISDVELEKLGRKTFQNAQNLQKLFASNNQLIEIPAQLFADSPSISYLDFSDNTIERIDPSAFEGIKILNTLNLSNNEISGELEKNWFLMPELLTLDLSHNNLTYSNEHVFDELVNLKYLDLSHNPIGDLKIGTFAYMTQLEVLSLKCNNISNIQLGTFSHQHKLVSLDLSENHLKMLDFELFLPILHDLQTLQLNQNQLINLYGFRNAIFPQLRLLDIKNNQFNCSYLRSFIASVDWSHLHMPVDPKLTKVHEANIRGVNCKNISSTESPQTNNGSHEKVIDNNGDNVPVQFIRQLSDLIEITSTSSQQLHEDINFIKFMFLLVCIFMIVLILLIALLSRDQLFNLINRHTGKDRRNKFSDPIVE